MRASTLLGLAPVLVAAQKCPLQFDGRLSKGAELGLLDTDGSPFNKDYVKGAGEFFGGVFFFVVVVLCFVRGVAWGMGSGMCDCSGGFACDH